MTSSGKPFVVGGGIEIVYDWANDGNPGTGWNYYLYPQIGAQTAPSPSVSFGIVQVYNFTPADYEGTFVNWSVSMSSQVGGPNLGFSATPTGLDQWTSGQLVTTPYSFYGGWNWSPGPPSISGGMAFQDYVWENHPSGPRIWPTYYHNE